MTQLTPEQIAAGHLGQAAHHKREAVRHRKRGQIEAAELHDLAAELQGGIARFPDNETLIASAMRASATADYRTWEVRKGRRG
jgi:hypothetical protein